VSRFLLVFHGDESQWDDITPEEAQAGIDAFWAFEAELMEAGAYLACEGLEPSANSTTLTMGEDGERIVTDGPYAETKEQLGGVTLIECESLEEAIGWARKVPLGEGWTIEVRKVNDYGPPPEGHPAAKGAAAAS
jgi:hypothetical protein